jgi:cytochrome c oxidase subunit IV
MNDDHTTQSTKMPGLRTYLAIYAALMILLVLTVAAAFIPWPRLLPAAHGWDARVAVAVALLIALIKSLLILLYFMHVKFSAKMVYAFAGAGFLWLGIMFTLVLSDYLTRNHPAGANDKGEPRYLQTAVHAGDSPEGKPENRPFEHSPRDH